MTTTINKTIRSPRRLRSREVDHAGKGSIPPGGIAREPDEGTPSPGAAFVAGAKAIVPVLIALIPFGLAFGATATGSGLSAVEALGMSVFVFAGAAQLAAVPLLLYVDGAVEVSFTNERLLAGVAAILIAWRTRSVPSPSSGALQRFGCFG